MNCIVGSTSWSSECFGFNTYLKMLNVSIHLNDLHFLKQDFSSILHVQFPTQGFSLNKAAMYQKFIIRWYFC